MEEEKKKSKAKIIIPIVLAVIVIAGGAAWYLTRTETKLARTGYTKEQIADMLQRFLHLPKEKKKKKLDATDALGIAYCHFLQCGLPQSDKKTPKDWTTFAKQKGLVQPTNSPNAKLLQLLKTKK